MTGKPFAEKAAVVDTPPKSKYSAAPDSFLVDLGFANLLVEKVICGGVPEVVICLADKVHEEVVQDIVIVRPAIREDNREAIAGKVDCFVWSDCGSEDYTDKFVVQLYKDYAMNKARDDNKKDKGI